MTAHTTESESAIHCPACGSAELRIERREKEARTQRGTAVPYWQESYLCMACGEEFLTADQSEASSRAYSEALRVADRLVSADEIRSARLRLDMTQDEFEDALGVGRKTVVRWERGTVVPSRAANGLLWIAVHFPGVFLEYAREFVPEATKPAAEGKLIATVAPPPEEGSPPRVVLHSFPPTHGKIRGLAGTGAYAGSIS